MTRPEQSRSLPTFSARSEPSGAIVQTVTGGLGGGPGSRPACPIAVQGYSGNKGLQRKASFISQAMVPRAPRLPSAHTAGGVIVSGVPLEEQGSWGMGAADSEGSRAWGLLAFVLFRNWGY